MPTGYYYPSESRIFKAQLQILLTLRYYRRTKSQLVTIKIRKFYQYVIYGQMAHRIIMPKISIGI
jgi:hypothetical protein